MVAISLLFIYMSFLLCLDPMMNQNSKSSAAATTAARPAKHYERQVNEELQLDNPTQECVFSEPVASNLQNNRQRSSAVLNLVTHEQSKWRKQVVSTFLQSFFSVFLSLSRFNSNDKQSTTSMNCWINASINSIPKQTKSTYAHRWTIDSRIDFRTHSFHSCSIAILIVAFCINSNSSCLLWICHLIYM